MQSITARSEEHAKTEGKAKAKAMAELMTVKSRLIAEEHKAKASAQKLEARQSAWPSVLTWLLHWVVVGRACVDQPVRR